MGNKGGKRNKGKGGKAPGKFGEAVGENGFPNSGSRGGGGGGPSGGGQRRSGGRRGGQGGQGGGRGDGRQPGGRSTTQDPIDVITGEVLFSQTDLDLAATLPLALERTHISSYRRGGLFGISWASTLDQRLELDADGVYFLSADAMILKYPQATLPNIQFQPVEGPQWPLVLTGDGGYTLTDPRLGRTLHFPAPGEEHGWSRLPLVAITDRRGNRIDLVYEDQVVTEIRHSGGYRIAVDTMPVAAAVPSNGATRSPAGTAALPDETAGSRRVSALRLRTDEPGGGMVLTRYRYDAAGHLSEVIDSSGKPLRFEYDEAGRLTGWHDRIGHWYRYEYDEEGRGVAATGSDGFLNVTLAHDPAGRKTVVTDALGNPTTFHYNEALQVVAEVDPLGGTTRSEWDRHDRLLSRTDPLGRTTRFSYDEQGNLTAVTRPDGAQATAAYDERHQPVERSEPGGLVWRRTYDEHGNLTASIDPTGAATRFAYDELGNLNAMTDPLGQTTRVVTNAAGLPVSMTDPTGATTRFEYDPLGRPATVVDPLGGVTRFGWTPEGRPASQTGPDGRTERWTYDAEGNLTEYIDAAGLATRTEYGPFELPVTMTGPDGARLEFAYDAELRVTAVTNPQGLVWRYEYDPAGNLVKESDFNGRITGYAHDEAGQLTTRTTASGQTITFRRDALGNVIEERSGERVSTFTYDPAGWLVRAVNAEADVRFERDALGRVTAEICNGQVLTSAYDGAGRRVRRRTPSGAESQWAYDAIGRPAMLATAGQTIAFQHDAAGREVQRRLSAGTVLAQQWDAAHQMTAQTVWAAATAQPLAPAGGGAAPPPEPRLLQHRTFAYRADGVVSAVGDRLTGDRRFDLDPLGQVTAVHGHGWTERYAYDVAGNVTDARWSGTPAPAQQGRIGGTVTGPEADAAGEREYDGTLVRRAGKVRYEYDAHGRVVLRQHARPSSRPLTWRYFWDHDDRLIGVQTPDGQNWRYRYDALGRRVAKQRVSHDGKSVYEQVTFVWDGLVLAEQIHQVWSPEQNAWTARGTVWEYEPQTFRPLTQSERLPAKGVPQKWVDERFYAIVTDLVGTPTELVDAAGGIAWHAKTTLWGTDLTASANPCPLRFPGQYFDPESRLSYNHHRYYHSADGRYQSTDPLGLMAGPNPHAYVRNPLGWLDPLGLKGDGGGDKTKVYHYTDKPGFNGIRGGDPYHIRPGNSKNGEGPFFTTKSPADLTEPNAFKKLGITNPKSQYVIEAEVPTSALKPLRGDRGKFIFETPGGIRIPRGDTRYIGPTTDWTPS
ncbi:DUF6531 domain-containing protein [Actinomadura rudentiformis]|uniref:Type IV secretion protein Rhs n=1 Tax=Actinomadura rudentiformis TaxID=359158 RepID=A0A6H9YNU2_9ACTN|nr:DUF6531 domain-containing protein [Actinomadura rudentiformis]KAB2347845.1 type IV secretion protein Rhs [Actinomadura rudentiformis]